MAKKRRILLLSFLSATGTIAQDDKPQDTLFNPFGKLSACVVFGDYTCKLLADESKREARQYSCLERENNSFNIRRLDYNMTTSLLQISLPALPWPANRKWESYFIACQTDKYYGCI